MNLFIHDHIQNEFIQGVVDRFFISGYLFEINDQRQVLRLKENKAGKIFDHIEISYYGSGLIKEVRQIKAADKTRITYEFRRDGKISSEAYESKRKAAWRNGRKEDGLHYRTYHSDGRLSFEAFVDFETGARHNSKGYTTINIGEDGTEVRSYFIMGQFIGENLPVGDDPETYLANYRIMT